MGDRPDRHPVRQNCAALIITIRNPASMQSRVRLEDADHLRVGLSRRIRPVSPCFVCEHTVSTTFTLESLLRRLALSRNTARFHAERRVPQHMQTRS